MNTRVPRWRSRRGVSRLGCLFNLLLVAFVGYYGFQVGEAYLQYYRIVDEMRTQARLAASIDDATIQRRVLRKAKELGLPDEASRNLRIRRTTRPREIRITSSYERALELPFYRYVHTFTPEARQPL